MPFLRSNPEFEFHLSEFIESTRFIDQARGRFDGFRKSFSSRRGEPEIWRAERARIRRAVEAVPAYSYINWTANRYWDDIRLISKDDIRDRPNDFLTPGFDAARLWRRPTSGTTGRPIEVWSAPDFFFEFQLFEIPEVAWLAGLLTEDFLARPFQTLMLHDKKYHPFRVWTAPDCSQGLIARYVFDEREPKALGEALDFIRRYQPAVLSMKPSILDFILRREPDQFRECAAKTLMVVSGGANLEEELRDTAQKLMAAPVINVYGLSEVNTIGSECSQQRGLHVWAKDTILEVLLPDGSLCGTGTGELVVSRIANSAMPLLRYRTGDIVDLEYSSCRCGFEGLMVNGLHGRVVRNFQLADGSELSPTDFDTLVREFPLREFRITQHDSTSVTIEVEVLPSCPDWADICPAIHAYAQRHFRGLIRVKVESVQFSAIEKFERYRSSLPASRSSDPERRPTR